MPVINQKKYEIAFKNLRHREIACLVQAVPKKNCKISSNSKTCNGQDKNGSKILKSLKKKLNRIPTTLTKNSKPLSQLDTKSQVTSKVMKKRVIEEKKMDNAESPKKQNQDCKLQNLSASELSSDIFKNVDPPVCTAEPGPRKRSYYKQAISCAKITAISDEGPASSSSAFSCYGVPVMTQQPMTFYRKELKIPAVPHNTPIMTQARETCIANRSSIFNRPTYNTCEVITIGKRGRGRPRLSAPVMGVGTEHSQVNQRSKSSQRGRGYRNEWEQEEEEHDQEMSAYEMLRQKNIEENLRKLREIFSEQGLHFEKKTSETPKKRKSYTRNPLPPPRPKSQRMVRRSSLPLDFCDLDEKLISESP
ncbi:uncharacterized protein LOC128982803 isoform X2 [Macrosteles quadrilineatus]|uniref:uncharacterized protein LOC128982803 isoform X2 n=1 Tax=Macrosteles quadrilineatus TaxID=74068 RepID=UPI0023E0D7AD|nr:uncharacterized protein LOC128982803 isoform X2 [Macrosteles quadrilineatus]